MNNVRLVSDFSPEGLYGSHVGTTGRLPFSQPVKIQKGTTSTALRHHNRLNQQLKIRQLKINTCIFPLESAVHNSG